MDSLITLDNVRDIKKYLGQQLPGVKSSHRVEAMARGLGWKSNAALRVSLVCGPTQCTVSDTTFQAYLAERSFTDIPEHVLSEAVRAATGLKAAAPVIVEALHGEVRGAASGGRLFRWPQGLVAVLIAAVSLGTYLGLDLRVAERRIDAHIEEVLTLVSEPAKRAVLILDTDLADEVTRSLVRLPEVTAATVIDDKGGRFSAEARAAAADTPLMRLWAMFVPGERQYSRKLVLPETLASNSATLVVQVNRAAALAAIPGPGAGTLLFVFLLGMAATGAAFGGMRFARQSAQDYLVTHYRLRPA